MTVAETNGTVARTGCFQVLALDGGGVRGIFTAALLAGLEQDLGHPIVDNFDLIVGTSTGGVIALALGAGLSPREILDFYVNEKDAIFAGRRRRTRLLRAKYRPDGLESALKRVFATRLLGDSRLPLVIPAYNIGANDVYLFKTPHHERLRRDHRVPMWQVAMATTAAPTYFPAFRLPGDEVRLVDGGVWANNPALIGVTEAVSMLGRRLHEIRVLSVGTTTSTKTRPSRLDNGGFLRWGRGIVDVLLAGQSAAALAQVQHLIGAANAHRFDAPAPPGLVKLDACEPRELIAAAAHHSRIFCPTFARAFAGHQAMALAPLQTANKKE